MILSKPVFPGGKPSLVLVGSLEICPSRRGTKEARRGQQGILLERVCVSGKVNTSNCVLPGALPCF